jgi:hypothetical protein
MPPPEDVTGALRAVWEVRRAEEHKAYCMGAWHNIVWGAMAMVLFAAYGVANAWALPPVVVHWLWLPPLLAAYTAIAYANKGVLALPRPALPWAEVALGTGLFVGLMGVLALALLNGVLRDVAAGMSMVIGVFYVILGLVIVHERGPAVFGMALAAGAVLVVLLGLPWPSSTLYGIFAAGGGMVAMGAAMLLRARPPIPSAPGDSPTELEQVRETLAGIRNHEAAVQARETAAKTFLAAAVMALGGVIGAMTGTHSYPLALLALAGATAAFGFVRQRMARIGEGGHGA